ncbi:MAG: hypothetical protein ACHQAY_05325 [Hyphomicrobiales bacterium]
MSSADAIALQIIKATAQEITERVIEATPVDTGYLAASWYARLNTRPSPPGRKKAGSGGGGALGVIDSMQLGDRLYVSNSAPYAMQIEFGFTAKDELGRQYHQRGNAFVRRVMDNANGIAAEVIDRLARK